MSARAPLRLLLTADAVGGIWQYATDLAGALPPRGVEPTIALLGPAPSPAQRALVQAGVPLIETGLPLDWLGNGPEPVLAAGRAIAAMAAKFDLVQLNMPSLAAVTPFPVPTIAVAHGDLATWWQASVGGAVPADMAWQVALTRAGLHAADAVVAPTRAFAEAVRGHHGLSRPPVAVHNGRRLAVTRAREMRGEVFTAGRLWDRAKNTAVLDEVAARLSVPFLAAGPTAAPHGQAVTLQHLTPLGTLDDAALAERLSARPVFVSAARFEPFGLAVLEAAQAGCALVLSDIAPFRELWDGAATFVPSDDAGSISDAVETLVAETDRRLAFGSAAAERARRYTPAATARAMMAVYTRLAPARRVAA